MVGFGKWGWLRVILVLRFSQDQADQQAEAQLCRAKLIKTGELLEVPEHEQNFIKLHIM